MEEQTRPSMPRNRLGRPRQDQSEEIGRRILETATQLFAERGYAATSVEQVAATCKVGKDTIYRRFPSKDALFKSVVAHAAKQALVSLDRIIPSEGDGLARLRIVARWLLDANLEPQLIALKRIAFSEAIVFGANVGPAGSDDPVMARLNGLVTEAQRQGYIAPGDPAFIADQLVYCITVKPSIHAMLGAGGHWSERVRTDYFEKAWCMFMSGAKA